MLRSYIRPAIAAVLATVGLCPHWGDPMFSQVGGVHTWRCRACGHEWPRR